MTTLDLKTQPIRLAIHRAEDASIWWFHRLIEHGIYRADLAWYYISMGAYMTRMAWGLRIEPAIEDTLTRQNVARGIIIAAFTLLSLAAATLALY